MFRFNDSEISTVTSFSINSKYLDIFVYEYYYYYYSCAVIKTKSLNSINNSIKNSIMLLYELSIDSITKIND